MDRLTPLELAGSERARDQLAKEWILEVVRRTSLADLPDVRVPWLARAAGPLIGDVLRALVDRDVPVERILEGEAAARAAALVSLYRGDARATAIPRDLAALHSLVIDALAPAEADAETASFAGTARRLAEVFGVFEAAVAAEIARQRAAAAGGEGGGLPDQAELERWLQAMIAEYRRYGHPFALLMIGVAGLERLDDAAGREAADRVLAAIGGVIRNQVRSADRTFQRGAAADFWILAPHHDAARARPLAERLVGLVDASQEDGEPRLSVTVGVGSCPDHADTAAELIEVTEEAALTARSEGLQVAVAGG